jgi:hypothetical protein
MKNIFVKMSLLVLLMLLAINSFADVQKTITSVFSINLPNNIKLTWQNKDEENHIYQFVFQSSPVGDSAAEQIRITAVGQAPSDPAEYNNWETKALGANIAMLIDSYHLDLSNQGDALGKKPEKIKLGEQTFTAVTMTFDDIQAYFLVTTTKNSTYNITLISIDKDLKARKMKMQKLLQSIKSMQYFGAKNPYEKNI